MRHDDARSAATLIQYALTPTNRPREGSDYRTLLDRYRTDTDFAELVRTVGEGLGVYTVAATPLGLVLSGDVDGPFRVTLDNCGLPIRQGTSRLQDRRCFALVLATVAAYAYPNGDALSDPTNPTVRAVDIERHLTRRIARVADIAAGDRGADDELDEQLGEAARMWLDLPEVLPDARGNLRRDCRRWYAQATLEFLAGTGRARKDSALADERGDAFTLNDRFRTGLTELAETAVHGLLAVAEDVEPHAMAGTDVPAGTDSTPEGR